MRPITIHPRQLVILAVVVGAVVVAGLAVWLVARPSPPPTSAPTAAAAVASPAPTLYPSWPTPEVPTTAPRPTTDPQIAPAIAYQTRITPLFQSEAAALVTLGRDCATGSATACYADAGLVKSDAETVQNVRSQIQVPACEQAADQALGGLDETLIQATNDLQAGINANSVAVLQQSKNEMDQANVQVQNVTGQLSSTVC